MNLQFSFLVSGIALASLVLPSLASAQTVVEFPRLDGSGTEKAILLPVDQEGLYATIGVVAADVTKGKVGEEMLTVIGQDQQTRITLLKGKKSEEKMTQFASGRDLKPGAKVFRGSNQSSSAVVSWENYFHGELLPLSFMRVHHQGAVPLPGSPLTDQNGKVVGICHQPSDTYGRGTYALPSEAIQNMVSNFKKHGKTIRSYCGISLSEMDQVLYVVGIRPDSPASKSGVKKNDIILKIDGRAVENFTEANNAIFLLMPDKEVEFEVLRGVTKKTVTLTPVVDPRHGLAPAQPEKK